MELFWTRRPCKAKIEECDNDNKKCRIADERMSSSGLTRKKYRMRTDLTNNNNIRLQHVTAITYSLCCMAKRTVINF
jgi:hypothetical protein